MSFATIDDLQRALATHDYVADRPLATAIFLALKLQKPLLLEGEAGVGKTEVAKTLAHMLDRRLIRLQCYEGLDVNTTIYEWNYTRQMLQIRLLESSGAGANTSLSEIFGPEFLIKRRSSICASVLATSVLPTPASPSSKSGFCSLSARKIAVASGRSAT